MSLGSLLLNSFFEGLVDILPMKSVGSVDFGPYPGAVVVRSFVFVLVLFLGASGAVGWGLFLL